MYQKLHDIILLKSHNIQQQAERLLGTSCSVRQSRLALIKFNFLVLNQELKTDYTASIFLQA